MKFIISTQEFNYLISKCFNVVSGKATIPILSNFLLEVSNNELIITATDLTVGIRCCTEVKVLEEGSTTLPAKKLAQLVRELTSVNLEVKTNANEVTEIIADSSRFKLHGMSKNEFPSLPDLEGALHFAVKQADLKDALFRTSFAVSREDNRYVLTGTLVHIFNGQATFVGTDGKRLARAILSIDIDKSFTGNFIIPVKAVEEIFKNLNDEGDAKVYLMTDKIAVETSNVTIITKLLSGDYPDIARVIPETAETVVALHREELMSLLRQMSLFTVENNHSVRFSLGDGELRLSANAMAIGEGKVSMPANYHGPILEIAFNPSYFLDILRHTKGETVILGVTDSYNPGVITDKEMTHFVTADATPLFVLMPMRLNEE
ncbi:MAG: DNA polymerase III subunit beta [Parachlamydiaceae bacterium]|nr:DNA polymerase III subunit beta [Parachlamydiaceae bacterium]